METLFLTLALQEALQRARNGAPTEDEDEDKGTDASQTPLMRLIANKSPFEDIFITLQGDYGDINAVDSKGRTALWHAARTDQDAVVRFLLDKGADITLTDESGVGPFDLILAGENLNLINLCAKAIRSKTDNPVSYMDGSRCQRSTLHQAAIRGSVLLVEFLLDQGLDANQMGPHGWTALHYAAKKNYDGIVSLLVRRGAIVNVPKDDGFTPLHIAAVNGNEKAVQLLLWLGADKNLVTNDSNKKYANKRASELAKTVAVASMINNFNK